MVYGQRKHGGALHSMAEIPDVVAHETFHGVTDYTVRLEHADQSGALNESYSYIFGVVLPSGSHARDGSNAPIRYPHRARRPQYCWLEE